MNKTSKPPEIIGKEIKSKCTCDDYHWPQQICPYVQDMTNGKETIRCNCCSFCRQNCFDDI